MLESLRDLWAFMRTTKKYWLLPIVLTLVLFALLMYLGQGTAAPFVYTLF